jgi:hypothetical protein
MLSNLVTNSKNYNLQSQVGHFIKNLWLAKEFYLGNRSWHNIWGSGGDGSCSSSSGDLVVIIIH